MNPGIKLTIESVQSKAEQGHTKEAIAELDNATQKYPESGSIWFLLGTIAFNDENFELAENAFKKLINLKPQNDLVLVGLFHSLWGQDKSLEALEETKRFIQVADKNISKEQIEEYMQIVRETNEDNQ